MKQLAELPVKQLAELLVKQRAELLVKQRAELLLEQRAELLLEQRAELLVEPARIQATYTALNIVSKHLFDMDALPTVQTVMQIQAPQGVRVLQSQ